MYTIEIDEATFEKAKARHQSNYRDLDITHILGDSAHEIEKVLNVLDPATDRVIAYLDAHWLDAIPTKEELNKLVAWGGDWIAIIDDFQVPNDSGYSFDQYGEVTIGKSQVPKHSGIRTFTPSISSEMETGAKRGTGYIFFGQSLDSLSLNSLSMIREL
jgi:hypothetical protein